MSLLERLTGATSSKLEQKADRLLAAGRWGEAKIAYEDALAKLARRPGLNAEKERRLNAANTGRARMI